MKEIEVKILDVDPVELVAKLKELGAKKLEQGIVYAKCYDFEDNNLDTTGRMVRARKIADRVEVTFKEKEDTTGLRTRDELEFTTSDFEKTDALFVKLGMKTILEQEKYRATYKIDDVKVEIEKYPGINWIAEVESENEETVKKVIEQLGFNVNDKDKVANVGMRSLFGERILYTNFKEHDEKPDYDNIFE